MKKNSRSRSMLASALCSTLCSGLVISSCGVAETDNPVAGGDVFDGTSPEHFSPAPGAIPPCMPIDTEEEPMLPRWLANSVVVPSPSGAVVAAGSSAGGLHLIDASDPDSPVELSRGVVEGEIHQVLLAASGELFVLATEPPRPARAAVPSATELDPVLRLVRVDISDPAQPVRIADATLEGEAWELRERDGDAWVLSARRAAPERACSAQENLCGFRSYEAVVLSRFRPNGSALEPIGQAELPFEQRAWWQGDGVVTALADGTLHAAGWDSSGALRTFHLGASAAPETFAGPAQVVAGELSVLRVEAGRAQINVYDLVSAAAEPIRSLWIGFRREGVGIDSLFAEQHLWLQAPSAGQRIFPGSPVDAELWDLTGAAPVQVTLPQAFHSVLPIQGATREGQSDEILAIGLSRDDSSASNELTLLSIRGGVASVIDAPELAEPFVNLDNGVPAPAGVRGTGDAPAWLLHGQGRGMPLGLLPLLSTTDTGWRFTTAFVGVVRGGRVPGASVASDAVSGVALVETFETDRGGVTALEFSGATSRSRIELSPQMRALVPTATGVVTVAITPVSQCEPSGADCDGYAPGVSVFDLSAEPRLVASAAFPELPLPPVANPSDLSVSWELFDPLSRQEGVSLTLGEGQLVFVAQVYLSCDNPADCDAREITAVPIGEANVAVGSPAPCAPSEVDPNCDATPPPAPTVYGTAQRQYFFVLDLDAPGGPAWEAWGVSRLAATSARTDRESRFASPIATDGVLAATRLERRRSATDLNGRGATRFFLDRFERSPGGDIVALPPVNVPGYPVARLGGDDRLERWLSVEAAPDERGAARLHRMNVQSDGARIEQSLDLGGHFVGFRLMPTADAQLGLVLSTPDGCGTSALSAIQLGANPADPGEPLAVTATLELPSDDWGIAATDGDLALLRRDFVYVLVRVDPLGTLGVVSSSTVDVTFNNEQLLGTLLLGGAGSFGHRTIDFVAGAMIRP